MSKREDILVALLAVLHGADAGMSRNLPLGEPDETGVFRTLRDGDIELTDQFFNGPSSIYEYTMTPSLIIVVEQGEAVTIDAALSAKIDAYVAALEAVTDLGGRITDIRPQPIDTAPQELFGTADKKGATLDIEIDFWSTHSVG